MSKNLNQWRQQRIELQSARLQVKQCLKHKSRPRATMWQRQNKTDVGSVPIMTHDKKLVPVATDVQVTDRAATTTTEDSTGDQIVIFGTFVWLKL